MSILVLDGDTNAGRAVLQSLARRGYECWLAAATRRAPAFASRYVSHALLYPDPLRDKAAFQEWIREQRRTQPWTLAIPVTESTLVPLHELRGDPDIDSSTALPPPAALEVVLDKERLLRAAIDLRIPVPGSRLLAQGLAIETVRLRDAAEFGPVVVKPIRSKVWVGRRGTDLHVRLAHTQAEAMRHLQVLLPLVGVQIQEWVPGHGVGIELLADRGRIVRSFCHERLHEYPLSGGASTYRRSQPAPPPLLDAASRLVQHLGWHGVAMVEFRVDAATGRFWLMELNARFWGSLPLAIFAGVDFPAALVDQWFGREPAAAARTRIGVYARSFSGEVDWCKEVIKARRRHQQPPPPSLVRSLLEWGRVFTGREIWDGWDGRDPGPLRAEVTHALARTIRTAAGRLRRAPRIRQVRAAVRARLLQLSGSQRVLVLCYGNICRSPYAAARLQAAAPELEVRSAGLGARDGRTSPELFRLIAASHGVDLGSHRARLVDAASLAWAETVIVMDEANERELMAFDRTAAAKTLRLGALDPAGGAAIDDPMELSAEETAAVLDGIDRCVGELVAAWGGSGGPGADPRRPPAAATGPAR